MWCKKYESATDATSEAVELGMMEAHSTSFVEETHREKLMKLPCGILAILVLLYSPAILGAQSSTRIMVHPLAAYAPL